MDQFVIIIDFDTKHPFPASEVFEDKAGYDAYIKRYLANGRSYRVFKLVQSGIVARSAA